MRASASLAWMLAVMCLEARDGRGFCSDSSEFGGWAMLGSNVSGNDPIYSIFVRRHFTIPVLLFLR